MSTHAHVLLNANARGSNNVALLDFTRYLHDVGYTSTVHTTHKETDLPKVFDTISKGVVIVIGGDGTIRAVAPYLINKQLPLVIIPAGTANNIALHFSLETNIKKIAYAIPKAKNIPFDIGRIRFPWGDDYFLEGMGFGLFADLLKDYGSKDDKSVVRSITAITRVLPNTQPYSARIEQNGEIITGEYLMAAIMNTHSIGPRLTLNPQADASDGLLNLTLLKADKSKSIIEILGKAAMKDMQTIPEFKMYTANKFLIEIEKAPIHVDGSVYTKENYPFPVMDDQLIIEVSVEKAAISLIHTTAAI